MRALSNTNLVEEAARKALSAQDLEKTLERFRRLCVTPGDDVGPLEEVAETLRNAGFKHELMQLLREALPLPNANPHVGALWIRRLITSKFWDHRYPQGLDALCQHGEVGHRAVIEFLQISGAKHRWELVRQALARHSRWLRTHPQGWAAAGRALARARCYRAAANWMSGWRDRGNLDLPTLECLALALRASGRTKDAGEVVRLALARPGAAERFPMFRLWTAEDEAFAENTQEASALFKQVDTVGWDDDALALYYLVRGVIRVQKAERPNRKDAFESAWDRVHDLFHRVPIYKRDMFLRREYRCCVWRMARDSGAWRHGIRALWRSSESWWVVPPLLVVPGLQLLLPCYLYRLCSRRKGARR